MTNEKLDTLIAELKARSAAKCLKMTINPDRQPSLIDSKLGGVPYWNASKVYPCDQNGHPMALLAQVNLDGNPLSELLPDHGLLQAFLSVDNAFLYGIDRDSEGRQSNCRVVWHENIDLTVAKEQVLRLGMPVMDEQTYSPVNGEWALDVAEGESYIAREDSHFMALLAEIAAEKFGDEVDIDAPWEYLGGEEDNHLSHELAGSQPSHQLLGHSNCCQGDPTGSPKFSRYDTLLMQIDSDYATDLDGRQQQRVMWGDLGTANFFINADKLLARDFSDVLYTWCGG